METHFSCKICHKSFEIKRDLKRHLVIRHQVEIYRSDGSQVLYKKRNEKVEDGSEFFACDGCDATFRTKRQLWDHRPRHKKENYIKCPIEGCETRMFKRDRFHHLRQIHTFETQLCEICTRTFRNYECLRRHKYKVHDSIKCKGCGSRVLKKSVDEHEKECSNHLEPKVELERNYQCASCDKAYSSSFLLRRHMRDKHNYVVVQEDSKFICSTCSEEFNSKMLYNRHIKVCSCLQCLVCSAPFKTTEKLDQHMLKHEQEKTERSFQCPHCTCRYSTASILSCHIVKRHTNEQSDVGVNFECPLCDQMYRKSILLKIHLESRHNLIKENLEEICVICDEKCKNLPNHTRNEHKKVFKCQHGKCKKAFRTPESLASHEKSHDDNFVPDLSCSVCLKVFTNQKALIEHFKKHALTS